MYRRLTDEQIAALPFPLFLGAEEAPQEVGRGHFDTMSDTQREQLWYIGKTGPAPGDTRRVFPFLDDTGVFAYVPKPAMGRRELSNLGWDDDRLEAERLRLFGPLRAGKLRLSNDLDNNRELMERRAEVWDEVSRELYKKG